MEWQDHTIAADKSTGPAAKVEKEIADIILVDFMEERMRDALVWAEEQGQKQKKVVHPTDSDEYARSALSLCCRRSYSSDAPGLDHREDVAGDEVKGHP
jgi:hypothetical protein